VWPGTALEIGDQRLHLGDFEPLRLDDLVSQLETRKNLRREIGIGLLASFDSSLFPKRF